MSDFEHIATASAQEVASFAKPERVAAVEVFGQEWIVGFYIDGPYEAECIGGAFLPHRDRTAVPVLVKIGGQFRALCEVFTQGFIDELSDRLNAMEWNDD